MVSRRWATVLPGLRMWPTYETRHLRVIVWCQFRYRLRIQPSLRVSLRKTPQADRMLRSFRFGGTRDRKSAKVSGIREELC